MERIVELNRGPFVGSPAPLEALSSPGDATVLDVRSAEEFARGHVHGAINIPVEGSFATKAGFVLAGDEHVALYAGSAGEAGPRRAGAPCRRPLQRGRLSRRRRRERVLWSR